MRLKLTIGRLRTKNVIMQSHITRNTLRLLIALIGFSAAGLSQAARRPVVIIITVPKPPISRI